MILFEKHGVEEKDFFQINMLKNFSFPAHFHRAHEIIYVNDGQLYVAIDQKEYILNKKELVFIFSNQIHEFKTIGQSEIGIILFSPELVGDFSQKYKGLVPGNHVIRKELDIDHTALRSVYGQKSLLYGVCADLAVQKSFTALKEAPPKVIHKMLLYVEENYSRDCSLKGLAESLKYDYPYLSKLFAGQLNMTFTNYLNNYRIFQACYLLKNSQQSIGDIAEKCGYHNLRTFHRNFRAIVSITPKAYRLMD